MLKRLGAAALLLAPFLIFSQPIFAQAPNWVEIHQFPAQDGFISASYFFNPMVGIIGFEWNITTSNAGMVKRTTDGGVTWTDCLVPVFNNTAPIVKDIFFKDQDTGWIAVGGKLNINDPPLWRTTDGGQTWFALLNEPAFTGPASVRQTPAALTVTEPLGVGIWTSTDEGLTWTMHSAKKNGLGFEDNNHGVATEYLAGDPSTNFLFTTDGGLNWQSSPGGIRHEAFGVYPVQHGGIFVCAPEDTMAEGSPVLRSTDNGQYWNQITQLPMATTGGIAGVNGVIYVQNSGANVPGAPAGLMRSVDSGKTWKSVRGPSQNQGNATFPYTDTRFSVTGCGDIVYASDGIGGLWKTMDGGDSIDVIPQCEFVDNDTMRPAIALICDTVKNIYFLHNTNPGGIVIQSLQIFDTTRRPDTTGAVFIDSFPLPFTNIPTGDSVAFGLGWHPGAMMDSAASDSATIQVIFQVTYYQPDWGLNPWDTIYLRVKLEGIVAPADFSVIPKSIKDTLLVCNAVDTTILFINKGCDSIAITSAQLAKNTWTLTIEGPSAALPPPTVPFHLGAGDTVRFRVRATPKSTAILADSLEVTMHYMGQDTSFGAGLRTSAKMNPLKPWLATTDSITFGALATCDTTESPLTLTNTGCDSLTITKADLTDSHYELLDTNGTPLKLPITIPTDSIRNVLVRFVPQNLGTYNTNIKLHYQYVGFVGFDSSNVVALSGSGSASGSVTFVPAAINCGTVSVCSDTTVTITFTNSSCGQNALIDSVILPAPFVLIDSNVNIGNTLIGPGKTLVLHIRYQPTKKTIESGTGTFLYALVGTNIQGDSSFTLTGMGGPGSSVFATTPPLQASMFAFPTISQCDPPDSATFTIYNTGCDTLIVTGVPYDVGLVGAFGNSAKADEPLPASLGSGDSLHVTVAIVNLATGTYNGNFHIQYTSADGTTHDSTIVVSSTITAGSGQSILTLNTPVVMDFNNIQSCGSADTTISLTYQGCGTKSIQLNLTGSGFTLVGVTNPILISPRQTITVHVKYDGTSTGNLSSTLNITSNVATNPNYTVQLSGNVQPPQTVHFTLGVSKNPVQAGDVFNATLTPDTSISNVGLNKVHGVFEYRQNNFNVISSALTGATWTGPSLVGTAPDVMEQYTFDVTGNNIQLMKTQALVSLPLEAMVSDSVGGIISVNSIALNGGDPQFNSCVLSTGAPGTSNVSFNIQCGDSELISILNGHPLVTGEQPNPNPVMEESGFQTTLNLTAAENGVAEITLYNALGEQINRDQLAIATGGTVPYTFHLGDLPAGSYYYAVRFTSARSTSGTVRGTFLLLK